MRTLLAGVILASATLTLADTAPDFAAVTATGETELNLNLDLNRSITLKGSTATDGDTSIGVFFERDY